MHETETQTEIEPALHEYRAPQPLAIREPAPSLLAPLPNAHVPRTPSAEPVTRFRQSAHVGELMLALAKAQGEITPALRESENQHTRRRYADLASVWHAIRGPLSKHGIAVLQPIVDGHLITRLCHGEQWVESELRLALDTATGRTPVQALGSSITYLRRYALSSLVGVAPDDDDDGQSDGRVPAQRGPQQQQQRRAG